MIVTFPLGRTVLKLERKPDMKIELKMDFIGPYEGYSEWHRFSEEELIFNCGGHGEGDTLGWVLKETNLRIKKGDNVTTTS